MKVKMILPALQEAESPYWRPIKYSLFPPLGLATLAAYFRDDDEVEIVDQHVEKLTLDDEPDLVCIQVYVTNAYRAYKIADHYRQQGSYVAMGGLHVTSLPDEAALHADTILLGPGEEAFPRFVNDLREGHPQKRSSTSLPCVVISSNVRNTSCPTRLLCQEVVLITVTSVIRMPFMARASRSTLSAWMKHLQKLTVCRDGTFISSMTIC